MISERGLRPVNTNAASEPDLRRAGEPVLSAPERAAYLAALEPDRADRERLRNAVWLALATGGISATARAVDTAMAANASRLAGSVAGHAIGLKLAAAGIVVSAALGGAVAWFAMGPTDHANNNKPPRATTAITAHATPAQVPVQAATPSVLDAPTPVAPAVPAVSGAMAAAPATSKRRGELTTSGKRLRATTTAQASAQTLSAPAPETSAVVTVPDSAAMESPAIALAEELRLLREASACLHRHDAASAVRWLREHDARFPNGALAKEASALQVMVMCQQGDQPRARAELAKFLRTESSSPLAERVKQACTHGTTQAP
jgi:hypothetical protein